MKDVAIIGFSGIFPGAESVDQFSQILKQGKTVIGNVTENRLKKTALPIFTDYVNGAYLEDIVSFDCDFFGIPLGEAEQMAPQQKLLLQEAFKTFEHANYRIKDLQGSNTSVYTTDTTINYYQFAKEGNATLVTGNMKSLNASRISRFFDLRGVAVNVDTTCSSGLTALTIACKDIQLEETELALVCGVNLYIFPHRSSDLLMGIESKSGVCAPFSSKADGTLGGESAVGVLLKRLDHAIRDQDKIHGIIKGYALNQDGSQSSSITAPSSEAQTSVIRKAITASKIAPEDITFIEAHGTGTKLGDPIEIEGIANAFKDDFERTSPLFVSSVKSNIGHTDSIAGLVGLFKVLLSFKNNVLYPSVNAHPLNEFIDFKKSNVSIVNKPIPWKPQNGRSIAGISSFGLMGTNAHVILEKYNDSPPSQNDSVDFGNQVFCFSAETKSSLTNYLKKFSSYIENSKSEIQNISYTLNANKTIFNTKLIVEAKDKIELLQKLKNVEEKEFFTRNDEIKKILVFDDYDDSWSKIIKGFSGDNNYKKSPSSFREFALLAQIQSYEYLKKTNCNISDMLGIGIGKITIQVLKNKLTQDEALNKIKRNDLDITSYDELAKKVKKLNKDAQFLFVGYGGMIEKTFKDGGIKNFYNFNTSESSQFNQNISSVFAVADDPDFQYYYSNQNFKKVTLPSYCFDKTRCWLREESDVYIENDVPQNTSSLKNSFEKKKESLPLAQQLKLLWEEILKIEVGINDDFFELGGHSLNGQQLINRINTLYNFDFDIDTLFEFGTPKEMELNINSLSENSNIGEQPAQKISKISESPFYEVSQAQKRLWLLSKLSNNTTSLNITESFEITGDLNFDILENAFHLIINRHESLRTIFQLNGNDLKQKILNTKDYKFELPIKKSNFDNIQNEILHFHELPFNLEEGPLIRSIVCNLSDQKNIVSISLHHIICDGWSIGVLLQELFQAYHSLLTGSELKLPDLSIQYKDYCSWEQNQHNSSSFLDAEQYWKSIFNDNSPKLFLKLQQPRPEIKTYNGQIKNFFFSKDISTALKSVVKAEQLTLTMLLSSYLNVLLYKLSGNTDLTIGLPISNRNNEQIENQIGLFLNMIPLRLKWKADASFLNLLDQSSTALKASYKNKIYPFELIAQNHNKHKDPSRFPLFDIVLTVQNHIDLDFKGFKSIKISSLEVQSFSQNTVKEAQFDIAYRFIENENEISYQVEYNTDIFTEDAICSYHEYLVEIIKQCSNNLQLKIQDISITSKVEVQKQIENLAGNHFQLSFNELIGDYLSKSFVKNQKRNAIIHNQQQMSYAELESCSNQIANYLIKDAKIEHQSSVIISTSSSPMLIVSIVGVIKAGLIYVPVDTKLPKSRKDYIKENTQAKLVIDDEWLNENYNKIIKTCSKKLPQVNITPEQIAYIIFTSGSTGKPKGVEITHKNLLSLLENCRTHHFTFSNENIWTLYHNYSFDFSIWEIFAPLFSGGQLILIDRDKTIDFESYIDLINTHKISHLNFTPKVFEAFEKVRQQKKLKCDSVKCLVFGGDMLNPSMLKKWYADHKACKIINMYGITEITVHGSYKELSQEDILQTETVSNIGKPLQGLSFYLFDEDKNFVPIGQPGEIYISGDQLAKGYIGDTSLTNKSFFTDEKYGLGRLYKSGDLGTWLSNGDIKYIGRVDNQVKINGFRIELEEIKVNLIEIAEVSNAHIMVNEVEGEKYITAYCQLNAVIDKSSIRDNLKLNLPHYMIPHFIVFVDALHLNSNGKIDESKLQIPENLDGKKEVQFEQDDKDIHLTIHNIIADILGYEKVNYADSFFDLGGNSLQLVQMHQAIEKLWPGVILISDLFELTTINSLSSKIEENLKVRTNSIFKKPLENKTQEEEIQFLEI